ncbi:DNA/RNA helicase [Peribacillus deserti]|uniref:DNA/RNA helicase n=2 Tax=Peribacillus deserti TaxID=673318 RepID=A0A2N5M9S6_9BACI|nr:DNA/RNA helicase [Peribacillus deserti]
MLEEHIAHGYVGWYQGLHDPNGKYTCGRCGNKAKHLFAEFPCSRCGNSCVYCRNCIMMGRVSSCSKLYTWTGPHYEFSHKQNSLAWTGTLSEAQAAASQKAIEAVEQNNELLVWAVCGAGKTEILFQAIEKALQTGKRICLATPRTDVVLELVPRFRKAFPQTEIAALYGGSDERNLAGQLIISTTHQLFRFQDALDVLIIDEVDAFPYSADYSLQAASQKSRKHISSRIYLTATPSAALKNEVKSGKLESTIIPARFHRNPIPLPRIVWCGNWEKSLRKKRIPKKLLNWISFRLQNNSIPFLIFFPTIKIMELALPLFQSLHEDIAAVHAEDPNRKETVVSLREGRVPGLLTTTILERGVTIPRLEVAVLGAESLIFTESALVQIAGRVGRKADFPTGNVTFFHYGKTEAMLAAVRHIRTMNKHAEERGLFG